MLGKTRRAPNGQTTNDFDNLGRPVWGWKTRAGKKYAVCHSPLKKKPGRFCGREDRCDNGRCRKHGGTAHIGIASPAAKSSTGLRHSKLREMFGGRFAALHTSDEKGSLEPEITAAQFRIEQLEGRLKSNGAEVSPAFLSAFKDYEKLRGTEGETKAFWVLKQLIEMDEQWDYGLWQQIEKLLLTQAKLVDTEERRKERARQTIAREALAGYTMMVIDILTRSVCGEGPLEQFLRPKTQAGKLVERIRRELMANDLGEQAVNAVMRILTPLVGEGYVSQARTILSDTNRGIMGLLPTGGSGENKPDPAPGPHSQAVS